MAAISSSPSPTSLPPPLLPPPAATTLNPIILIVILLLLIAFLFSLPLLRHLSRRSTSAITSSSAANHRSGYRNFLQMFARSSSAGDCAICLSEIRRRDLLRRLPICRHCFHVACIDAWLRFNQTCPLCRSPVHGVGGANFLPEIGSGG